MNKKLKTFVIVLVVLFVIVVLPFSAYQIFKSVETSKCVSYLSEKYSGKSTEFDCIRFSPSHYYLNDDAIPMPEKSDNKWIFVYQGKEFFVYQEDGRYYDDYQLKELEKLSTEFLQENVSPEIIGIEMDIYNISAYKKSKYPDNPYHIITKAEIKDFLCAYYKTGYVGIYISGYDYDDTEETDKIKDKIRLALNTNISEHILLCDAEEFSYDKWDWYYNYGFNIAG